QAEDGIRGRNVTGVQTCALPILVTFVSTSLNNLSLRLRLVTYLPSLPANGESFTMKFMLMVGSSILTNGSGSTQFGSQIVSPILRSGMPATHTISPRSASVQGTRFSPSN